VGVTSSLNRTLRLIILELCSFAFSLDPLREALKIKSESESPSWKQISAYAGKCLRKMCQVLLLSECQLVKREVIDCGRRGGVLLAPSQTP
jgi:hypothetical protein